MGPGRFQSLFVPPTYFNRGAIVRNVEVYRCVEDGSSCARTLDPNGKRERPKHAF